MATEYDFIIVGSGPAGASVAFALAQSPKKPKVLILEAGSRNDDRNLRVSGQRWLTFLQKDLNFGYKTCPQQNVASRELDYSRGKGLGGSSAINFGAFTVGASHDYDTWAKLTDDEDYSWPRIQGRFKKLITFHRDLPAGTDPKYASPLAENHGSSGPLHLGYAKEWEEDLVPTLDLLSQSGYALNPDHNSGNPIGVSLLITSTHDGLRSTANDILSELPDNFTVLTSSPVQNVIFSGKKAIGVSSNGTSYFASREVILSAGALDTPRILMHSGIGPTDQLTKFGIPVLLPAPRVGQNLRDRPFMSLVYRRKPGSTASKRGSFYGSQAAQDSALAQWQNDGTGPWSKYGCQLAVGFLKLSERFTSSREFRSLPEGEQEFLNHETVPHMEFVTHFPVHMYFPPGAFPRVSEEQLVDYSCLSLFLYNPQSRGEATLQSSDPDVPLRFDPRFFAHEFDRRAAADSLREFLERFVEGNEEFRRGTEGVIAGPEKGAKSSDEELLDFWREGLGSTFHMTGTAKMGKRGEEDAVVDSAFRVIGVEGLRVADMSVVPVLVSGHTQAVAYVTGYTCGEKLLKEYDLL
ncbi:oxidoreductase [Cladorrhinum samala]|uniref:Oxidoreductase n=1 Tax=Cladorrhinum samala TaxID=585594 RepID=A0AAV9HGR3_9PEZI|nr:oxidoreductase [Cladorrhinum samala]